MASKDFTFLPLELVFLDIPPNLEPQTLKPELYTLPPQARRPTLLHLVSFIQSLCIWIPRLQLRLVLLLAARGVRVIRVILEFESWIGNLGSPF